MADFIETDVGWVNLDHVVLVRVGDVGEESSMQLSDGRTMICRIISTTPRSLPLERAETDVGPGGDYSVPGFVSARVRPAETPPAPAPAAETDVGV